MIFCKDPIDETVNLNQDTFGATGPENKEMVEGDESTATLTSDPRKKHNPRRVKLFSTGIFIG